MGCVDLRDWPTARQRPRKYYPCLLAHTLSEHAQWTDLGPKVPLTGICLFHILLWTISVSNIPMSWLWSLERWSLFKELVDKLYNQKPILRYSTNIPNQDFFFLPWSLILKIKDSQYFEQIVFCQPSTFSSLSQLVVFKTNYVCCIKVHIFKAESCINPTVSH